MEALLETAKSIVYIGGAIFAVYTVVRELPFKLRDRKQAADKAAFDLYTEAMNELAERDEGFRKLRELFDLEIKRGDEQAESIRQLQQVGDECAGEIRRLKLDLNHAHQQTNVFEGKWKLAERKIEIMYAILSRNELLTPAIEAEIAASLEDASATPPDAGETP